MMHLRCYSLRRGRRRRTTRILVDHNPERATKQLVWVILSGARRSPQKRAAIIVTAPSDPLPIWLNNASVYVNVLVRTYSTPRMRAGSADAMAW
jgi:hypothetical protein